MKKYLLHIGAVFLMTLCTLPALAHLNGSDYYRIRNAETGKYLIISNDKFDSFNKIELYNPDIEKIVNYFKDKEAMNPHAVNPEYLKLTEAEESKL